MLSAGRNSLLENISRQINRFFRSNLQGSQRSVVLPDARGSFSSVRRNYDLEIAEVPIRNSDFATQVIELVNYSSDAVTAIEIIVNDIFSNQDGDDQGFKIDELLDDGTAIDSKTKEILDSLFDRVVGGLALETAIERMISYGDAFVSLGIGKTDDGLGIVKLLTLPTWELFRKEDDQATLLRFEQRKSLDDKQPAFVFHPAQIVHFRNRKKVLYGRPLFGVESLGNWNNLKDATDALAKASLQVGINPNVHTLPQGANNAFKDAYKKAHDAEMSHGVVTNYYLEQGADIKKLSMFDPDLKALIETVSLWRSAIITRSRLPLWMFSGFTALNGNSAKEISEQPSLAYSRLINSYRMRISEGLKQICLTELILKGVPEEKRKFRIVHPKIYVSTNQLVDPDNQEESDPTNPNSGTQKQAKAKPKAKTVAKSKGDSLEWLEGLSRDELIEAFKNTIAD